MQLSRRLAIILVPGVLLYGALVYINSKPLVLAKAWHLRTDLPAYVPGPPDPFDTARQERRELKCKQLRALTYEVARDRDRGVSLSEQREMFRYLNAKENDFVKEAFERVYVGAGSFTSSPTTVAAEAFSECMGR